MKQNNQPLSADQLMSLIERIEHLEEEKAAIQADIREIYSEAKGAGFEPKYIREMIKLRKLDPDELDEHDELEKMYRDTINL